MTNVSHLKKKSCFIRISVSQHFNKQHPRKKEKKGKKKKKSPAKSPRMHLREIWQVQSPDKAENGARKAECLTSYLGPDASLVQAQ